MMRDYDRCASLFTPDGALRMPNVPADLAGREAIRAWGERVPAFVDYLVQTTHPGTIQIAAHIMASTALTTATYDIDGGLQPGPA